jgi:hypothetical protein
MTTTRAVWTAAEINDFPDASFACIDAGGTKDDEGKTVPRSLRHYPHHDADGNLDLPHLRNALARVAQEDTTSCGVGHLRDHAEAEGIGEASRAAPSRTKFREERVFTMDDMEIREEGGAPTIIGHPLLYDVWSEDLGGFRERIRSGAASTTILQKNIKLLFNHDPNIVLASRGSGTLDLTEQVKGVRMRATAPANQFINDLVLEPMRRGDIDQMSFAFRVTGSAWNSRDGGKPPLGTGEIWNSDYTEREILQLVMFDVSVVTFPAYAQTDASVRTLPGLLDGLGFEWGRLTAALTRSARGLPIDARDVDIITATTAHLREYLPEPEPAEATTRGATEAGQRTLHHLRTLLDVEAASA